MSSTKKIDIPSPQGNPRWESGVIHRLIKNPAYKGQAAFGKRRVGPMLPRVRPQKDGCEQPKANYSLYDVEKENWLYIPVPPIVDEDLFETVQEQLEENKKITRARRSGASYLLQGLVVCYCCRYAYYGRHAKTRWKSYKYYACTGADAHRFGGHKLCNNKQLRAEFLETVVWEEVKHLLKNPQRILEEYRRRINELKKSSFEQVYQSLNKQKSKLERSISRLIDSYAEEYITKKEFEPRIKSLRKQLALLNEQEEKMIKSESLKKELAVIITNMKYFETSIKKRLEKLDWNTQRDIIRILVKRIEVDSDNVNVVFRVNNLPNYNEKRQEILQHCHSGRCLDFG